MKKEARHHLYTCLTADPSEPPRSYDRSYGIGPARPPALELPGGINVDTDLHEGTAAAAAWWRRLSEVAAEIAAWHDQQAAERTTAGGAR